MANHDSPWSVLEWTTFVEVAFVGDGHRGTWTFPEDGVQAHEGRGYLTVAVTVQSECYALTDMSIRRYGLVARVRYWMRGL